jgi:methylmalonyl-CoA/ethylmalonyl-CoA epimerase
MVFNMDDSLFPNRIDHIGLLVHDIETSAIDLIQRLGMTREIDEIVKSVNVRLLYLRCLGDESPTFIQLVQPLGEGPLSDFLNTHGEGLHHVCFAVNDIPQLLNTMGVSTQTKVIIGGRSHRTCFLTDRLSGMLVELTEGAPYSDDNS